MCFSIIVISYVTMGKITHHYREQQEIPMIFIQHHKLESSHPRQSGSRKIREMLSSLTGDGFCLKYTPVFDVTPKKLDTNFDVHPETDKTGSTTDRNAFKKSKN